MASNQSMLTVVLRDRMAAVRAYEWLQTRGYRSGEINVLMSDRTRTSFSDEGVEGKIKAGDKSLEGVAAGGAVGTAIGATVAAILAIGTTVAFPGLGIVVAGPLLAGLAGGGAGAVTGGLVGGLVGLGIPESNALAYEEALKTGGVVLGVTPRSSDDSSALRDYFEKNGGENIVTAGNT